MTKPEYDAYVAKVASFLSGNDVQPGCHSPKEDQGEGFFSWRPCECCRRPLGGTRETYQFARNPGHLANEEPIFEADICTDCVYFLAYGQLDDATMLDIEASMK